MVMQTQKNLKYYDNYTTLWISKEDYMGEEGMDSTQNNKGSLTALKAL